MSPHAATGSPPHLRPHSMEAPAAASTPVSPRMREMPGEAPLNLTKPKISDHLQDAASQHHGGKHPGEGGEMRVKPPPAHSNHRMNMTPLPQSEHQAMKPAAPTGLLSPPYMPPGGHTSPMRPPSCSTSGSSGSGGRSTSPHPITSMPSLKLPQMSPGMLSEKVSGKPNSMCFILHQIIF